MAHLCGGNDPPRRIEGRVAGSNSGLGLLSIPTTRSWDIGHSAQEVLPQCVGNNRLSTNAVSVTF